MCKDAEAHSFTKRVALRFRNVSNTKRYMTCTERTRILALRLAGWALKFLYISSKICLGGIRMAFLVLGKLDIKENDYNWIQSYREKNDELYYNVVYPHFTVVFPTFGKTEHQFRCEVLEKSKGFSPINFNIRCAVINKDAFNDYWHVFLVPDEGHSDIIKLHDMLYSDTLLDTLLLDIQFVPHIGIANSKDKWVCKKLVDEINTNNINISGTIRTLDIVVYENNIVKSIEKIDLK